jgi:hypothetical protein
MLAIRPKTIPAYYGVVIGPISTATVAEEEFARAFIGGCGIIFGRLSRMETHPSSRVEHEIGEP